ncbi:MAG: MFS transporter [Salinirussus sp.]
MASLRSLFGDDAAVLRDQDYQLLLLVTVPTLLGTTMLSPVLDSLIEPFGTSAADIGLLISAFTAPAIVIIPVAGAIADRIGRKPVLVWSLLLFGAAGTAVALTTDFRIALGFRLLQGIGFAGLNPTVVTCIRDLFTGSAEATGQGLRVAVAGLGQTVFSFIAGVIVAIAWQLPFLLYAMSFPIAVALWLRFEEPAGQSGSERGSDYVRALLGQLGRPTVAAMVTARGLVLVTWFGFVTFNSIVVVRVLGGSPSQAGAMVAVASTVFAITASQAGRVTARFGSRLVPLLAGNIAMGLGLAIFGLAPAPLHAAGGVAIAGAGFGLDLGLYRSVVSGLAPADLRAGVVSVAEAGGRVVATLTPLAMGVGLTALEPAVGFDAAVRTVLVGAGVVAWGGTTVCVGLAAFAGSDGIEASASGR